MMIFAKLFFEFFKIGLFAIGGGMATIPFLYRLSDTTHWFSHNDLSYMIAVGESTPGPIGVNMATYVGYISGMNNFGGIGAFLGAIIATLGLITPSIIIILIISHFLEKFRNNILVEKTFYGLRPASTGLIAAAGLSVIVNNLFLTNTSHAHFLDTLNIKGCILALVLLILTNFVPKVKKLHPIVFILFSALVGIVFKMG